MSGDPSGSLKGKSFYLHDVKRHQSVTFTDIIVRLGGKIDSFLTKDVNVVVTGVKEAHSDLPVDGSCTGGRKPSGTPKPLVCGSRGKALLEKAIHSNEKCRSSVLANARSWGVKVYYVDDFIKIINHLDQKLRTAKKKRSKLTAPHVKAGVLRSPYLKVEDYSRKFRPFYAQTISFPSMSYSGKFSPFEALILRKTVRSKDEDPRKDNSGIKEEPTSSCHKLQLPLTASTTIKGPTKKSSGYCECCHMPYKDQHEHLESEIHRSFIQNESNYAVVDQLTARLCASFVCIPNEEVDPTLMKPCTSFSPLHLSDLTEMMPNTVSENQTPLVQDFGHLPSITEIFAPSLANRENFPDPIQNPSGQQDTTSHLYTMQNNCPGPLGHDQAGLYITCTTKVQEFQSHALCMDLAPHMSSKLQKNLSSGTLSEDQLNMRTLSSGVECVSKTQAQHEGGHGHLVLHRPTGLKGAVSNTVCSQNQKWFSKDPKMLLQEGGDDKSETCGQLDRRMLLSTNQSLKLVQNIVGTPEFGISYFPLPCPLPFPNLSDYSLSLVNLKKRCRSFTPSPKLAKRRKTGRSEKPNAAWKRQYSSVLSTMAWPVSKVDCKMNNQLGDELSVAYQEKYFTPPSTQCLPHHVGQQDNAPSNELFPKDLVESRVTTYSSNLEPPQLVPFDHEDHQLQCHQYQDPPELLPFFSQTPEYPSHALVSKASNSSFLSHSGTSVCIESALVPNLTWSPASSESDWDSGLLSWLTTAVPLQAKKDNDDMGLLLQKPHTGMQDGSYTSRLCSILQPS